MQKLLWDLHTHTRFSHGAGSIEDNVQAALSFGMSKIGIADHGPGHKFYGIRADEIANMRKAVFESQAAHPEIEVLLGVEANIVNPSGELDVCRQLQKSFDYIIAGYHYGYWGRHPLQATWVMLGGYLFEAIGAKSTAAKNYNTDLVLAALYNNPIKILSHPGAKAEFDVAKIAEACEKTGTWMEINNKHGALTTEDIKIASKYDVKFIISSDAHKPCDVGSCEKSLARAKESGLDLSRIVNLRP